LTEIVRNTFRDQPAAAECCPVQIKSADFSFCILPFLSPWFCDQLVPELHVTMTGTHLASHQHVRSQPTSLTNGTCCALKKVWRRGISRTHSAIAARVSASPVARAPNWNACRNSRLAPSAPAWCGRSQCPGGGLGTSCHGAGSQVRYAALQQPLYRRLQEHVHG